MKRFLPLLALFAALLAGTPAPAQETALSAADQAVVDEVEAYLDGIETLSTAFLQVGPDGGRATGNIYLSRPGRMRVQFDPPAELVMVATPVWLIIDDGESQQPTYIPIRASAAYILTRDRITLNDSRIAVTGVTRTAGQVLVRVAQKDDPDAGAIIMIFHRDEGLTLSGWTIIDDAGAATQVQFFNTEIGGEIDPDLFLYTNPQQDDPIQIFE